MGLKTKTTKLKGPKDPQKTPVSTIVNSVIGVAIMFVFPLLGIQLYAVTDVGMRVLGIFIGTIYLWSTVDVLWSSMVSTFMLLLCGYKPVAATLAEAFGGTVIVQTFFLLIIIGCLIQNKITLYMGRFFLERKFTNGKPWLFTFVALSGVLLMSAFINTFASIFVFWPVMYSIFADLGYTNKDKYPKIMLVLVVIAALLGFPVAPFMQNGIVLLNNFRSITGDPTMVNDLAYMLAALVIGFAMLALCVLLAKFVFRPDVEKLKNFDVQTIKVKDPLPPLHRGQKIVVAAFVVLMVWMLLPSLLPESGAKTFFQTTQMGASGLIITAALCALRYKGQPVLNLPEVMGKHMNWGSYFLVVVAILLGNVLTSEATGIVMLLEHILGPLFVGLSPLLFTLQLVAIGCLITNLCNSLVVAMILQPIVATYCNISGANPAPIVTAMIIFVLSSAVCTPAASPFAAILHGNREWLTPSESYRYAAIFTALNLVVMLTLGVGVCYLFIK